MSDPQALLHSHDERLRRLELRHANTGAVPLTTGPGITLSSRGGARVLTPEASSAGGVGAFLMADWVEEEEGPLNDRFSVGLYLTFPRPKYITVIVSTPAGEIVAWDPLSVAGDPVTSGALLGWSSDIGASLHQGMFRLHYDGYADRYGDFAAGLGDPVYGRYRSPEIAAFPEMSRLGEYRVTVILDPTLLTLYSEVPSATLHAATFRYGEDFGRFTAEGVADHQTGPLYWDTVVDASTGFTLSDDRRTITVPPGVGGWYRYAGHAQVTSVDGARGTTQGFEIAGVGPLPLWEEVVPAAHGVGIPGTAQFGFEEPTATGAGAYSGTMRVPAVGGDLQVGIGPDLKVEDSGIGVADIVSAHVDLASFSIWRVGDL